MLLGTYVAFACNVGVVTWALSPFHRVTPTGLLLAEMGAVGAAIALWIARGQPVPDLAPCRAALRLVAASPVTLGFVVLAGAAISYELMLALSAPPGNWDSLTYHLGRVLSWRQANGIGWIPNAPTARMNEFQPFAEQWVLFLLVGTGSPSVLALPQLISEIVILLAVFGAARRLGFDVPRAACAAALLSTLSLIALEATTEQNDLVAASFVITAACLLLARSPTESVLAGIAIALGAGTKLTVVLALPVIAALAWMGGRATMRRCLVGIGIGTVLVGAWSFVLNVRHTGSLLGTGEGRVEHAGIPTLTGIVRTIGRVLYRLIDVSVLGGWVVGALALAGLIATVVRVRRGPAHGRGHLLHTGVSALPFLVPGLALWLTTLDAFGDPPWVDSAASNDYSAFGPVGMAALVIAPLLATRRAHRDRRRLALAATLPLFIVLLAFYASYNIWITRFLVIPVVLTAPLFALLFRDALSTAAWLTVATVTVTLTLTHDNTKPLNGPAGRPWNLTQSATLEEGPGTPVEQRAAAALTAYDAAVPADACVGAVLDPDDFSSLLWGTRFSRRVTFLSSTTAPADAARAGLRYVVISNGANAPVGSLFGPAGWIIEPLGTWWLLATDRVGVTAESGCTVSPPPPR